MKIVIAAVAALAINSAPAVVEAQEHHMTADIPFGDLPRQTLDIYTPATINDETPVLMFLFGGGFSRGDKRQASNIGQEHADAGIIVVAPNYRVMTTFPAFVEDAASAVAYVYRELRTGSGDPRPIFLSGWSAGGYIAGIVSYDQRYLEAEGVPQGAIAGFIGLAGPYSGGLCRGSPCPNTFPPGTEADWPVAAFVDADDPPMLLAQGTLDNYVDIGHLETLAATGEEAGIGVTTVIAENRGHSNMRDDLASPGTDVHSAVASFIAEYTSGGGAVVD